MAVKVLPEIKALIPPLTLQERELLEGSILSEGCRDALSVWDGFLLDGHNRYEICVANGIEYDVHDVVGIKSIDDAKRWIIRNQLGRRNLTNYQRAELALQLKPLIAEMAKENLVTHTEQGYQKSDKAVTTSNELAKVAGVSHDTIHKASVISEKATEEVKEQLRSGETSINHEYNKLIEKPHTLISQSKSNEWYTPPEYVDAARDVMGGIDCDPASNETAQKWIQADEYYTIETDGLTHEWGCRVWLNPPWGRLTGDFISKLSEEMMSGRVEEAIILVNAHATDTKWFGALWDGLLCFTDHRIDYHSEEEKETGSTHGSVFVYFGTNRERFIELFAAWGAIVERVHCDD